MGKLSAYEVEALGSLDVQLADQNIRIVKITAGTIPELVLDVSL